MASSLLDAVDSQYQALLGPVVGDTGLEEFLKEWVPLLLTVVAPLIALPFVALGICGGGADTQEAVPKKSGARLVLRRLIMTVRADIRAGREVKHTKLLEMAGFKNAKKLPPCHIVCEYDNMCAFAAHCLLIRQSYSQHHNPQSIEWRHYASFISCIFTELQRSTRRGVRSSSE